MAVTLTAADLAAAVGADDTTAGRLLGVAKTLVEGWAPDAPEAIQNEAVIRAAGWLNEHPASGAMLVEVGGISTRYASPANAASALRHSGAMSLLSDWKVRRAGAI